MGTIKPRVPNAISAGRPASSARRVHEPVKGKPRHDFERCIACAACAVACDAGAIRHLHRRDEGLLVWTLDLYDCTQCGRCVPVCPTGAMGLIEGAEFADDPEPPKRCLFALAECESCGRYYATNKEVAVRERAARAGGARRCRSRSRAHVHLPRLQAPARCESRRQEKRHEARITSQINASTQPLTRCGCLHSLHLSVALLAGARRQRSCKLRHSYI